MRYPTNQDLPFVCQLNLPEPALELWRNAFNDAWSRSADPKTRHCEAQAHAFSELRRCFEKDAFTGRWMERAGEKGRRGSRQPHAQRSANVAESPAARQS